MRALDNVKEMQAYRVPQSYAIANDRASIALFGKDRPVTEPGKARTARRTYKTGKKGNGEMSIVADFTPEYMAKRPEKPERGLTREQKSVLDGIMTCMSDSQFRNEEGNWIIPIQAIVRLLRGTDKQVESEGKSTIHKEITSIAWELSNVYLDLNVKRDVGMEHVEIGKRTRLINLSLLRVKVNGQQTHALEVYDSIVYRYAQAKNQVMRFPRDTVALRSVNLNLQNISIRDYILQHIACKTEYARYVNFDDLYNALGLYADEMSNNAYKCKVRRVRATIFKILDEYIDSGKLASYEKKCSGQKIMGVSPGEWRGEARVPAEQLYGYLAPGSPVTNENASPNN